MKVYGNHRQPILPFLCGRRDHTLGDLHLIFAKTYQFIIDVHIQAWTLVHTTGLQNTSWHPLAFTFVSMNEIWGYALLCFIRPLTVITDQSSMDYSVWNFFQGHWNTQTHLPPSKHTALACKSDKHMGATLRCYHTLYQIDTIIERLDRLSYDKYLSYIS